MTLREQLLQILPDLLPKHEDDAIKGKELIARVRNVLGDQYSDHSLRSQFSFIALDPGSCLARVPNGQGYYLRNGDAETSPLQSVFGCDAKAARESNTPLHKALALAVRLYDTAGLGVLAYPVDGEESWEHPDLAAVQWPAGYFTADGVYVMESDDAEELNYCSVCVAFADGVPDGETRRAFFRSLACGQWAEKTELLLFGICDNKAELTNLAARYGVGVRCLELSESEINRLPSAADIFRMDTADAADLLVNIPQSILAQPRNRAFCAEAAAAMPAVGVVLDWANTCVQHGQLDPFAMRVAVD